MTEVSSSPPPHGETKGADAHPDMLELVSTDPEQQQHQQHQQSPPRGLESDPDEPRPSLLSCILAALDCALGIFVILTREVRPAYAFLSTTAGIIVSILLVVFALLFVNRDSFWERHAVKRGIVETIKGMLLLSAIGLTLTVFAGIRDVVWLDCIGLFVIYAARPTEPAITAAVTFSTNSKRFSRQARLRKIGMCVGVCIGVCFAAIVYAGDSSNGSRDLVTVLSAVLLVAYISGWVWIRYAMKAMNYTAVSAGDVTNLFELSPDLQKVLVDKTFSINQRLDESRRGVIRKYLRYLIANGFAAHFALLLSLAMIIAFTGHGRTGDSLLAICLVELVAVLVVGFLPFSPDKRMLINGSRVTAGLVLVAVGIAVPWIYTAQMGVEEGELAWTMVFFVPYLLLAYDSDQPMLDVARLSALQASVDKVGVRPHRDEKFRKTMFHYSVVAQSMAELFAFICYAANISAWKWALLVVVILCGTILVLTTATARLVEKHIIVASIVVPEDALIHALNGISLRSACCGRQQQQQYPNNNGGGKAFVVADHTETDDAKGTDVKDDDGKAGHSANGHVAIKVIKAPRPPSPSSRGSRSHSRNGVESDPEDAVAAVAGSSDDPISDDLLRAVNIGSSTDASAAPTAAAVAVAAAGN